MLRLLLSIVQIDATPPTGGHVTPSLRTASGLVLTSRDPTIIWAPSSHLACHDYLTRLAKDNYFQCPGHESTDGPDRIVLSRFAKPCPGGKSRLCDAAFECIMINDFRGCPKRFWQEGMNGQWTFRCKQFPGPRMYPYLKNPEIATKAHVLCLSKQTARLHAGVLGPASSYAGPGPIYHEMYPEDTETSESGQTTSDTESMISFILTEALDLDGGAITYEEVRHAGSSGV